MHNNSHDYHLNPGGEGRKRKKNSNSNADVTDSEEEDDEEINISRREKDRAVEFISDLLYSQAKKSEDTTHAKKSLKQFSEADFDREHKELLTKKMRLEVKVLEDQSRFWSRMGGSADKILKAVEYYVESKMNEMSQVTHLYTNSDGTTVLQTAYNEALAPNGHIIAAGHDDD